MISASHSLVRVPAVGLMLVMAASCAMPPRQAWHQIQTEGLLSFYMKRDGAPLGASGNRTQMLASASTSPAFVPSTAPAPAPSSMVVGPERPNTPPPSMLNTATMPIAQTVPDLPGYVRTPFTNPPRLVDVRGMSAGSKVVCPYTQRPFLVPGGVSSSTSSIASAPEKPRPQAPERKTSPVTPNSNVAANNVTPSSSSATASTTAPAVELPYGTSISGRPGFVNSPYAAKHQLVDVTGLPVGMEVKCPYTGKLFRVPPQ